MERQGAGRNGFKRFAKVDVEGSNPFSRSKIPGTYDAPADSPDETIEPGVRSKIDATAEALEAEAIDVRVLDARPDARPDVPIVPDLSVD